MFRDEKLIGNTRADPCSRILKRELGLKWLRANVDPQDTALIFGIHFTEDWRLECEVKDKKTGEMVKRGVRPRYQALGFPYVEAPMCEVSRECPPMGEMAIHEWLAAEGIEKPRLYRLGFSHNNCGGFCVKAGEGHFANLLRTMPERYAEHEAQEEAFNASRPGRKRQTVLAPEIEVSPGKRKRIPISLAEFREKVQSGAQIDLYGGNGCGCFLDDPAEAA